MTKSIICKEVRVKFKDKHRSMERIDYVDGGLGADYLQVAADNGTLQVNYVKWVVRQNKDDPTKQDSFGAILKSINYERNDITEWTCEKVIS